MSHLITREKLIAMLQRPDRDKVIGRALVAINKRQTQGEQVSKTTRLHNEQGFTPADAYSGTMTALYFLKHGTLTDWQIDKWIKLNKNGVPRLAKYWAQLDEEAKERMKEREGA